jgi:hypothetical protein
MCLHHRAFPVGLGDVVYIGIELDLHSLAAAPRCHSAPRSAINQTPPTDRMHRIDRSNPVSSRSRPEPNKHATDAYRTNSHVGHDGLDEHQPTRSLSNHDVLPLFVPKNPKPFPRYDHRQTLYEIHIVFCARAFATNCHPSFKTENI